MTTKTDYPDFKHVNLVCKIGKGADCCRYLAVAGDGWSCLKHTTLKEYLDRRVREGKMRARSDNCPGKEAR